MKLILFLTLFNHASLDQQKLVSIGGMQNRYLINSKIDTKCVIIQSKVHATNIQFVELYILYIKYSKWE